MDAEERVERIHLISTVPIARTNVQGPQLPAEVADEAAPALVTQQPRRQVVGLAAIQLEAWRHGPCQVHLKWNSTQCTLSHIYLCSKLWSRRFFLGR